eukprot:14270166-Heterocapsa_arctica.AAC.1
MGGYAAGGSSSQCGGQNQDGASPGGQNGGVANPGPPPPQSQDDWTGPPQQWHVGQWIPATWLNGGVASWKQVAAGDVNPWDNRIAQSLQGEWLSYENYGKGHKGN